MNSGASKLSTLVQQRVAGKEFRVKAGTVRRGVELGSVRRHERWKSVKPEPSWTTFTATGNTYVFKPWRYVCLKG